MSINKRDGKMIQKFTGTKLNYCRYISIVAKLIAI